MKPRQTAYCAVLIGISALVSSNVANSKSPESSGLLPGSSSKEPVSIDADKLVYLDKEQRAIYSGNVIVIQGATKFTCSEMTLTLAKTEPPGGAKSASAAGASAPQPGVGATQVSHMDCAGPVSIVSKTQVATGDKATYDKPNHKFWLTGHVALTDGGNVTKGDQLTYDLESGQAVVSKGGANGRVHGLFSPGAGEGDSTPGGKSK